MPRLILGALVGDYIGSTFEKKYQVPFDVTLPAPGSRFTDDSVLTVAIVDALRQKLPVGPVLRDYWKRYPHRGYGHGFSTWAASDSLEPYNSYGNGAAMRASPAGWMATSEADALALGELTAQPTHSHESGIKAAKIVALLVYLGKSGMPMNQALAQVIAQFGLTTVDIEKHRAANTFVKDATASVELSLSALLAGKTFEEIIRWSIYLGGDVDTTAAIAGSVAEAFGLMHLPWARLVVHESPVVWLERLLIDV